MSLASLPGAPTIGAAAPAPDSGAETTGTGGMLASLPGAPSLAPAPAAAKAPAAPASTGNVIDDLKGFLGITPAPATTTAAPPTAATPSGVLSTLPGAPKLNPSTSTAPTPSPATPGPSYTPLNAPAAPSTPATPTLNPSVASPFGPAQFYGGPGTTARANLKTQFGPSYSDELDRTIGTQLAGNTPESPDPGSTDDLASRAIAGQIPLAAAHQQATGAAPSSPVPSLLRAPTTSQAIDFNNIQMFNKQGQPTQTTAQYAEEAQQAKAVSDEANSASGIAKQTASQIVNWAGTLGQSILSHVTAAISSPRGALAAGQGAVQTAVLKPLAFVGGMASAMLNAEDVGLDKVFGTHIAENNQPVNMYAGLAALNDNVERTPVEQQAYDTGSFLGWMVPYSKISGGVEAAADVFKAAQYAPKLAPLIPYVADAAGFIGTGQILHSPDEGSRVQQLKNDAIALVLFNVGGFALKGASTMIAKGLSSALPAAVQEAASEAVQPVFDKMQAGESVPADMLDNAVTHANGIIEDATGKNPQAILQEHLGVNEPAPKIPLSPDEVPAHNTIDKAIPMYHEQNMGRFQKGLDAISSARDQLAKLQKTLKNVPQDEALQSESQKAMVAKAASLQDYIDSNKQYEQYWKGTRPGETEPRAQAALHNMTDEQAAQYHEQYKTDVAKQVSLGYDMPKEITDQFPETKAAADAAVNKNITTADINTPERAAMRDEIADKVYGEGAKTKGKRLDIVTGGPGTRKSSMLAEPLAKEHDSFLADSDTVKREIPEYGNGEGTKRVHDESAQINAKNLKRAIANGDNVVWPTVGAKAENVQKIADLAKENGYDVHLHHADLPEETAQAGVADRFKNGGQYISPEDVHNMHSQSNESHGILSNDERFTSTARYSTDVPRGDAPNLLEHRGEGVRVPGTQQGLDSGGNGKESLVARGDNNVGAASEGVKPGYNAAHETEGSTAEKGEAAGEENTESNQPSTIRALESGASENGHPDRLSSSELVNAVQDQKRYISFLQEAVDDHPAKDLIKYYGGKSPADYSLGEILARSEGTANKSRSLDSIVTEAGFKDTDHAQEGVDTLQQMKEQLAKAKDTLRAMRADAKDRGISLPRKEIELPPMPRKGTLVLGVAFPGADIIGKFIEKDVIERFGGIKNAIKGIYDATKEIFSYNPLKEKAAAITGSNLMEVEKYASSAWKVAEARRDWWAKMPEDDHFAFIDKMETNDRDFSSISTDPDIQKTLTDLANEYHARLDKSFEFEGEKGVKENYIQSYFPHMWEDPEEAARALSKFSENLPQGYSQAFGSFKSGRVVDLIATGRALGLKLITSNPEELVIIREIDGQRIAARMSIMKELEGEGLAHPTETYLEYGKPSNWSLVKGSDGTMYAVAPDAAKILNNAFFAPSLWSMSDGAGQKVASAVFKTMMAIKGTVVPFQLSLSGFHPFHVATIASADAITRSFMKVVNGEMGAAEGFAEMAKGMSMIPQAFDIKDYWNIGKAWDTPMEKLEPRMKAAVQAIIDGGGSPKISEEFAIRAADGFKKAVSDGNYIGAAIRGVPRVVEALQDPILGHYVPSLKIGAYLSKVEDLLHATPTLATDDIARKMAYRAAWKEVDSRFGEMVYKTKFWNPMLTQIGEASFLSLGWQLGFVDQFVGGALDLAKLAVKLPGGAVGLTEKATRADLTSRSVFSVVYTMQAAMWGGLMTYAMTGKMPTSVKDLFYPNTGKLNSDGSEARLNTPFYTREFFGLVNHVEQQGPIGGPVTMIEDKANPILNSLAEIWNNKDFYGYEIHDPNNSIPTQAAQVMEYLVKNNFTPISVQGAIQANDITGRLGVAASIAGFNPAPKYIAENAIQTKIFATLDERDAGTKPLDSQAATTAKSNIKKLYQSGDTAGANAALKAAIAAGYIKSSGLTVFMEDANLPGDVAAFKDLTQYPSDQAALLATMSESDLQRYAQYAASSVKAELSTLSPTAAQFVKDIKSGKIKVDTFKAGKIVTTP